MHPSKGAIHASTKQLGAGQRQKRFYNSGRKQRHERPGALHFRLMFGAANAGFRPTSQTELSA
jgi:hypothetical protein